MDALEETGLTPADPGFYPAARQCVIDLGIVRRRKVDVAADIPARRIADLPVELDGRGRPVDPGGRAGPRPPAGVAVRDRAGGPDVRRRRRGHRPRPRAPGGPVGAEGRRPRQTGENVFSMMRRIGQAKAGLAADYAAQLARSAGKVVFFAKHIDVMDVAEETFARQGDPLLLDPRRPDARGAAEEHRRLRERPGRRHRGLLPDRGRRGPQPAGRLQHRARRAVLDRRRADPGHRPQPPHRSDRAGHRVAHHRRADHRRPDRRADRQQGGARRPGARRLGRGGRRRRPTSSSRRSSRC